MEENKEEGTPFKTKCEILRDFWIQAKLEPSFKEFLSYNDLGLPAAYMVSLDLIPEYTPPIEQMISETWAMLLTTLEVEKDVGFENIDELFLG
jgi:hypothetical protein